MTHHEVMNLAREAGLFVPRDGIPKDGALMRLVTLIAAAERAACADICEQHASVEGIAQRCAEQIRARSKI
jgi:uncharacterized protein YdbL (DUF1318 family)